MPWNHRQSDAPAFIWDADRLRRAEWLFLSEAGMTAGAARHLSSEYQGRFTVGIMSENVRASFEIDGECLDPDRLDSCIVRRLGLALDDSEDIYPETYAADLAVSLSREYRRPVGMQGLVEWRNIFAKRGEGALFPSAPKHSIALVPEQRRELKRFLRWFNNSEFAEEANPLFRAGLAHLWFESIQMYPEGSGVLGRAIAEKALLQGLPGHTFTPLCLVLGKYRHEYHRALDDACRDRDATAWLTWFAAAAIEAGRWQRALLEYSLEWEGLLASLAGRINGRQMKMLEHLFRLGPEAAGTGFGAPEFSRIFGEPLSAIKRDLIGLVRLGALVRRVKGHLVHYHLALLPPPFKRVQLTDIL